jgi:hypothetical protein
MNGTLRRFNNKAFESYEQARQYIRRYIRKNVGVDKYNGIVSDKMGELYDNVSRNFPSISCLGFAVRKIA